MGLQRHARGRHSLGRETELEEGTVDEEKWQHESKSLGIYTGDSADAELYALAFALDHAVERVKQGEDVKLVRMYTDCERVLKSTRDGSNNWLGLAVEETWTLQKGYAHADWLDREKSVGVELVWVKGHAGDAGNELTDFWAKDARRRQLQGLGPSEEKRKWVKMKQMRADGFDRVDDDSMEEGFYRVNKPLLEKGEKEPSEDSDGSKDMNFGDSDSDQAPVLFSPPPQHDDVVVKCRLRRSLSSAEVSLSSPGPRIPLHNFMPPAQFPHLQSHHRSTPHVSNFDVGGNRAYRSHNRWPGRGMSAPASQPYCTEAKRRGRM